MRDIFEEYMRPQPTREHRIEIDKIAVEAVIAELHEQMRNLDGNIKLGEWRRKYAEGSEVRIQSQFGIFRASVLEYFLDDHSIPCVCLKVVGKKRILTLEAFEGLLYKNS